MIFSCIIPVSAKDADSQMLKDLIGSIRSQDFDQSQIEILVMGEECGDSEQSKAAGILKAQGEICAMFCADNLLMNNQVFKDVNRLLGEFNSIGIYSKHYAYVKKDNSLNRYFSLMGNNDPIAFYLGKSDRKPFWEHDENECFSAVRFDEEIPSLGDNGFFFKRSILNEANIDNYYPMDVAVDLSRKGYSQYIRTAGSYLWHRTSDNLLTFLKKRYRYARDLYSDRTDRRWKMLATNDDVLRLGWFIVSTITVVPCLVISIKGFLKIKDWAWFWHWPVCFGFLITYSILTFRNLFKYGRFFQRR